MTLIVVLVSTFVVADDAERPNVLFIMVDDLRPELGAYDHHVVKTPNIDEFSSLSLIHI